MIARAALLAVIGTACYTPSYQDCAISCAISNRCPSGLDCVAGVCRTMTGECPGGGSGDGGVDAFVPIGSWLFRKKVTLRGMNLAATNFPLLVQRASDSDLASFAQSDGGDLRFTTLDGVELPYELERFVESTGELVAWVKIPSVAGTTQTDFWMYYGNAETPNLQNPSAVWDSAYAGVWHLSDPPGSSQLADSTSNNVDAVKVTTNSPAPVSDGKIATAYTFAGASTDRLSLGTDPAKLASSEFSFEAWLMRNPDATNAAPRYVFVCPEPFQSKPVIAYYDEGAPQTLGPSSFFVQLTAGGLTGTANTIPGSAWIHLAVASTGNPQTTLVLVNGVLQPVKATTTPLVRNNTDVTLAGTDHGYLAPNGRLDEIRYSRTARTFDYLRLSFATQNDSSLVTFGPAEGAP